MNHTTKLRIIMKRIRNYITPETKDVQHKLVEGMDTNNIIYILRDSGTAKR